MNPTILSFRRAFGYVWVVGKDYYEWRVSSWLQPNICRKLLPGRAQSRNYAVYFRRGPSRVKNSVSVPVTCERMFRAYRLGPRLKSSICCQGGIEGTVGRIPRGTRYIVLLPV